LEGEREEAGEPPEGKRDDNRQARSSRGPSNLRKRGPGVRNKTAGRRDPEMLEKRRLNASQSGYVVLRVGVERKGETRGLGKKKKQEGRLFRKTPPS